MPENYTPKSDQEPSQGHEPERRTSDNPYEDVGSSDPIRDELLSLSQRRLRRRRQAKRFGADGTAEDLPEDEQPERPSAVRAGAERLAASGRKVASSAREGASKLAGGRHDLWKPVGTVLLVVFAVLAVGGFALFRSAMAVRDEATQVRQVADVLDDDLTSGDYASLSSHVTQFVDAAQSMHSETSSPLWGVASVLPGIGRDVSNARVLTATLDDFSQNALVPFLQNAQGAALDDLASDGKVNIDALRDVVGMLGEVGPSIQSDHDALAALEHGSYQQLNDDLDATRDALGALSGVAGQGGQIAAQLPSMLGADGATRTYLVVLQNGSQLRGAGGDPVAWGTISVTDGAFTADSFADVASEQEYQSPQLQITGDERKVFGDTLSSSADYSTMNPDFTRSAKLMSGFWQLHTQGLTGTPQHVDGVIAVDPWFLQDLLGVTGGASAGAVTIDGTNAAQVLMNDAYWNYGSQARNQLFCGAMGAACQKLVSSLGKVDTSRLLGVFGRAGSNRDLLLWFNDAATQNLFAHYQAAGTLAGDRENPKVGIYLNDLTGCQADWYLSVSTTLSDPEQLSGGDLRYEATTVLQNRMSQVVAQDAPDVVTGSDWDRNKLLQGAEHRGDLLTHVLVVAPDGGVVSNVSISESRISRDLGSVSLNGASGEACQVYVPKGGSTTVKFVVDVPAGGSPLQVSATPTQH